MPSFVVNWGLLIHSCQTHVTVPHMRDIHHMLFHSHYNNSRLIQMEYRFLFLERLPQNIGELLDNVVFDA